MGAAAAVLRLPSGGLGPGPRARCSDSSSSIRRSSAARACQRPSKNTKRSSASNRLVQVEVRGQVGVQRPHLDLAGRQLGLGQLVEQRGHGAGTRVVGLADARQRREREAPVLQRTDQELVVDVELMRREELVEAGDGARTGDHELELDVAPRVDGGDGAVLREQTEHRSRQRERSVAQAVARQRIAILLVHASPHTFGHATGRGWPAPRAVRRSPVGPRPGRHCHHFGKCNRRSVSRRDARPGASRRCVGTPPGSGSPSGASRRPALRGARMPGR